MKKKVQASVITSLLLVPTVMANAEENINNENPESSTVSSPVVASTFGDTVSQGRLYEILDLNHKSSKEVIQAARTEIDALFPPVGDYSKENELLIAKIDFLEALQALSAQGATFQQQLPIRKRAI